MHLLITAGPTREYLDPVRFITNASSGQMGYACAAAALRRKHQVTLITGPVHLNPPKGAKLIKVLTCEQMYRAVRQHFPSCDCLIMTAAVGDYRPQKINPHKIKKNNHDLTLKLTRTTDILAQISLARTQQILIGFAVEDRSPRRAAQKKLIAKNLDAIILNSPAAFGTADTDAHILTRDGSWQNFPHVPKKTFATAIIKLAQNLYDSR